MVNIAVVIPKYRLLGGAEGFVFSLTERLAPRPQFEVHVFANRYREGKAPIVFHRVPIIFFPRFLKQISFAYFANRRIRKGDFDLVHSHDRIFKMDLFTFHGIPHETWVRRMRNKHPSLFDRGMMWVEKKGLTGPPVPRVLAVSSLVKRELQKSYPFIEVMHPGVSLKRFSPENNPGVRQQIRERHGIGSEDLVILFVGMNFEIKRLGLLIQGIAQLPRKDVEKQGLKLLVVGKGKEAVYRDMAGEYGVEKSLVFAGATSHVERYYQASDVLAMPSVYDTFGMVVLEAMAAGLPVIITRTVGAGDLVEDGVQGFVLGDPPTAAGVAEKFRLLFSRENRLKMGRHALRRALEHSWDRVADRMADLYLRDWHEYPCLRRG